MIKPRVVAELGRPETAEETAARKADQSLKHRQRQTTINLVLSLGASLIVVLILVLIVPRGHPGDSRAVDVLVAANGVSAPDGHAVLVPKLPQTWSANSAELRHDPDGVVSWYVGYLTPTRLSDDTEIAQSYIGMYQVFNPNPTWIADLVGRNKTTSHLTIGGKTWAVYNNRSSTNNVGNARYVLRTETNNGMIILLGTAKDEFFTTLAETALAETSRAASNETKQ